MDALVHEVVRLDDFNLLTHQRDVMVSALQPMLIVMRDKGTVTSATVACGKYKSEMHGISHIDDPAKSRADDNRDRFSVPGCREMHRHRQCVSAATQGIRASIAREAAKNEPFYRS